jgi:hypothetical protein
MKVHVYNDKDIEDIILNVCGKNPTRECLEYFVELNAFKYHFYRKNPENRDKHFHEVMLDNYANSIRVGMDMVDKLDQGQLELF